GSRRCSGWSAGRGSRRWPGASGRAMWRARCSRRQACCRTCGATRTCGCRRRPARPGPGRASSGASGWARAAIRTWAGRGWPAALAGRQTWPGAIVAAAVLGVGFGVFTSVDFALMTDVLPKALDRGKDLGVINVANALPQVAAPALAAPIVTYLGGYRVLYLV